MSIGRVTRSQDPITVMAAIRPVKAICLVVMVFNGKASLRFSPV